MESDGFLQFQVTVTADRETDVNDILLEVPLRADAARYLMGMNRPGGFRPARHEWHWDRAKNQDSVWVGDVNAGLRLRLKGENYVRPLVNVYSSITRFCACRTCRRTSTKCMRPA